MPGLRELCLMLDDATVEFFEKLDEIYKVQFELEQVIRDGWADTAKARYIMGAKSVGALQYNVDDLEQALTQVKVTEAEGQQQWTFEIARGSADAKSEEGESEPSLRRRVAAKSDDATDEISNGVEEINLKEQASDDMNKSDGSKSPKVHKDPIRWFGVLVPQCLRHGQKQFQRATELSCTLATLQGELLSLKADFRKLHREKDDLLNSVDISSFMEEMGKSGDSFTFDDAPEK